MPISPVPPSGRKARSPACIRAELIRSPAGQCVAPVGRDHARAPGCARPDMRSPSSVRSGSICSISIVPSANSGARPPVAITFRPPPILRLDARDQALDHADIAPVDAGLHRRHRVAADHRLRPADADARQTGGGLVQRLDRQIDAGRDHAAEIGAVLVHHVEGGGGAEVDHHQRAAVFPVRRRARSAAGRRRPPRGCRP